jgi:hypothetical protein
MSEELSIATFIHCQPRHPQVLHKGKNASGKIRNVSVISIFRYKKTRTLMNLASFIANMAWRVL